MSTTAASLPGSQSCAASGINVLLNEHVVLQHNGSALVIAGVTDHSGHHFDESHRSDPAAAVATAPD